MSQVNAVRRPGLLIILMIAAGLLIIGCGSSTPNPNAPGGGGAEHTNGWLPANHATAANADMDACAGCHGADYSGGMAGVSCTSCHLGGVSAVHPAGGVWGTDHRAYVAANTNKACANGYCHGTDLSGVTASGPSCTSCHLGGVSAVHPAAWSQNTATAHGPYATTNGTTACANLYCHGADLKGVANSGPSCTSCHLGDPSSVHPLDWQNDALTNHRWYAFYYGTAQCANANCHGADLKGVAGSGPSCETCHTAVGSVVPNKANCGGCHHFPPSGTASPDVAGKHGKHTALPFADCSICHQNHNHQNGSVDVAFASIFSAKSGSAAWSGVQVAGNWVNDTCSKVSCHGGQTTPNWSTGTIDVATQCTSCHAVGTAEYNSCNSGKHDYHVNTMSKACTDCHDAAKLDVNSNHFKHLNTSVMEGPASATLLDSLGYANGTCSTPGCHGSRAW